MGFQGLVDLFYLHVSVIARVFVSAQQIVGLERVQFMAEIS